MATDSGTLGEVQSQRRKCGACHKAYKVIDFVPLPIGTGAVGNKAARQRKTTDGSSLPRANGSVSLAW